MQNKTNEKLSTFIVLNFSNEKMKAIKFWTIQFHMKPKTMYYYDSGS
jgi:hypothetical protein